jgi:AcrR family transcriptional regulator
VSDDVIWMRPHHSTVGRPARLTREALTRAAVRVADAEGLAAVTMRSIASELGTGGGSLYRHVTGRDELVDLMVDHVAGEYVLEAPTGDGIADLTALALQGLAIHRRHRWLGEVVATPVLGPHGLALTEHVLTVLERHPAADGRKLVAFATMNALTTAYARSGHGDQDPARARGQAAYIAHLVAEGRLPRLAALRPEVGVEPDEVFPVMLRRVLRGLLDD